MRSVAAHAARAASGEATGLARARARTATGRWVVVRGSVLGTGPDARVAVMFEPARRAEMAPLLVAAYGFTDQERRVLDLLAEGLTNRQIGERLYLAEKTVKNYVSNLLTKLGMHRRTEAAVYAAKLAARRERRDA